MLPAHVIDHRSVAGLASDRSFRHRGMVCVSGFIVIFAKPRVVATGAHRVPRHAASGPVAPFAGLPILVAEDVEPFVFCWIVTGFHRLHPAVAAGHEELPQWVNADHSDNRVSFRATAEAHRGDLIFLAFR